jgi:serine/threonine-protein kinase
MEFSSLLDGRYQIQREVGGGAMGAVYLALDTRLDRQVAIKTIRLDLHSTELDDFRARFEREARATGRLNHPNIVIVYDSGVADSVAYIAMEFLSGTPLDDVIRLGAPLPVPEAAAIIAAVADALAYAHEQGVIHRDIKPSNIVRLDNGLIKLTDFGIAQTPHGDLTQTGVVLGTPKYMAPEQIAGQRVDGRADLFSLGCVFYELLTGHAPFMAPTLVSLMHTVLHTRPDSPQKWVGTLPRPALSILARCLGKEPRDRYATAGELLVDLQRYPDVEIDEAAIEAVFDVAGTAHASAAGAAALSPRALTLWRRAAARLRRVPTGWRYALPALAAVALALGLAFRAGEHEEAHLHDVVAAPATSESAAVLSNAGTPASAPASAEPAVGPASAGAPAGTPPGDASPAPTPVASTPAAPAAAAEAAPAGVTTVPAPHRTSTAAPRVARAHSTGSAHHNTQEPAAVAAAKSEEDSESVVGREWHRVRRGVVGFYDEQRDCVRYNKCSPAQTPVPQQDNSQH